MIYLFDTNILLHYIRQTEIKDLVERDFNPSASTNHAVISVVSVGEIRSISLQNKWGAKRLLALEDLLSEFIVADINADDVIKAYALIDAFSQGSMPPPFSLNATSRNMGKNDLWIAATAYVLGATLLTTDFDFSHLAEKFIRIELLH
jgi:tRNA(fMet)-specific endonuclease VapC